MDENLKRPVPPPVPQQDRFRFGGNDFLSLEIDETLNLMEGFPPGEKEKWMNSVRDALANLNVRSEAALNSINEHLLSSPLHHLQLLTLTRQAEGGFQLVLSLQNRKRNNASGLRVAMNGMPQMRSHNKKQRNLRGRERRVSLRLWGLKRLGANSQLHHPSSTLSTSLRTSLDLTAAPPTAATTMMRGLAAQKKDRQRMAKAAEAANSRK